MIPHTYAVSSQVDPVSSFSWVCDRGQSLRKSQFLSVHYSRRIPCMEFKFSAKTASTACTV